MKHSLEHTTSKPSIIKYADGEFYTKYFAKSYDILTTLSGWRVKIAEHALADLPPGNTLDVGCGTGYLLHLAKKQGRDIVGLDASEGMLQKAKERYGFSDADTVLASADDMPFASDSIDVVIASGSLVHIPSIEKACSEIIRIVKPQGHIRIIDHATPIQKNLFTKIFYLFSQMSGDILHDYAHYFKNGCMLKEHKTLGRGGYLQCFDFVKM